MVNRFTALCVGLFLTSVAVAQPPVTTIELTLKPAGPPVPSLRHELLPASTDLRSGNAALHHHRALHLMADQRKAAKEEQSARERFEAAFKGPIAAFPADAADAYLKPYAPLFREVEAGARCDKCEWGLERTSTSDDFATRLPTAQKLRDLAYLLKLRTRTHLASGKIDAALRDVQTGIALGRHAAEGPSLLEFLVGNAIASIFLAELELAMQAPGCPNLYWSLTALPRPLLDLRKGLAGERQAMEASLPSAKDVGDKPMTTDAARTALEKLHDTLADRVGMPRPGGEGRFALAAYVALRQPTARQSLIAAGWAAADLDAMPAAQLVLLDSLSRVQGRRDEHFVWYCAPYPEAAAGLKRSRERNVPATTLDVMDMQLNMLLPAMDRMYYSQVRTDRRLASLRAVEAVRLHAAAHDGRAPATLAEVREVPVPVDPWTGKPFVYAATAMGFTLEAESPAGLEDERDQRWKYVVTLTK